MKIAFVGLGNMGWPMAANLAKAGYPVTGIDADRARAESWANAHDTPAAPTSFATSIAAVSDVVDVVVTMLPSGVEVREVLLAAARDAKDGLVAVDMSSADPVGTRELHAELATSGIRLVDASNARWRGCDVSRAFVWSTRRSRAGSRRRSTARSRS